ncbi:unnamed protein product, partial [Pleuronectes platessa]
SLAICVAAVWRHSVHFSLTRGPASSITHIQTGTEWGLSLRQIPLSVSVYHPAINSCRPLTRHTPDAPPPFNPPPTSSPAPNLPKNPSPALKKPISQSITAIAPLCQMARVSHGQWRATHACYLSKLASTC